MSSMENPWDIISKLSDLTNVRFIAQVIENNDPLKLERIKVSLPKLFKEETPVEDLPWIAPHSNSKFRGPEIGGFSVPDVGTYVYVEFQQGRITSGFYTGGVVSNLTRITLEETNYPNRYGLIDSKGNHFYVDKQEGSIEVKHFSGTTFKITPDGSLEFTCVANNTMSISGNTSITTSGNTNISTSGTTSIQSNGNATLSSQSNVNITAPTISLNGTTSISSSAPVAITSTSAVNITSPSVRIN